MRSEKIVFKNRDGQQLAGRLELPVDRNAHNYVLFAHCFTCTKNLLAIKNISRSLTQSGFGVFRFDFTGLGESEGEFEDTNFSGNVEDLIAAAEFMAQKYQGPTVLVGHSLGGAAVIYAAEKIPSIRALATIGAPSSPEHVTHLLESSLDEIETAGVASVNLGGRIFTIKKQFLDDLRQDRMEDIVRSLRKPIAILHSPQDDTVGIVNAEMIYRAAFHPKSFISLDGADHLLSDKDDSLYAGSIIASWASRYVTLPADPILKTQHQVMASLNKDDGFTTHLKAGNHYMLADEPLSFGGLDYGPSPYELLSASLSACTAMTLHMYAKRKSWPLEDVEVHTSYSKDHAQDCEDCESPSAKIDTFTRAIKILGDLDQTQRSRLLEIADKCPVHKTLHSKTQVLTSAIE